MIGKVPGLKLIVNGDDALSAYLAMDTGHPTVDHGISRPVVKNDTNEIREGRFPANAAAKDSSTVFIITVSWETTSVRNVDSRDRYRITMQPM